MGKPSFVYLISDGEFTKIGTSTDVPGRLKGLQTANPKPLHLLTAFPGSESLERRLHRAYEAKRSHGEWFRLTKEDVNSIAQFGSALQRPPKREEEEPLDWSEKAIERMFVGVDPGPPFQFFAHPLVPDMRRHPSPFVLALRKGDQLVSVGEMLEVLRGGTVVTSDRMITEIGVLLTLQALAQAESAQEENELLLQAAVLDSLYTSRTSGGLGGLLRKLEERQGERYLGRDPERVDEGTLSQIGALQTGTRKRRFLPFIRIQDVLLESAQGVFTVKAGLAAVLQARAHLQEVSVLFSDQQGCLSPYPTE